jgi:hypothetical protein
LLCGLPVALFVVALLPVAPAFTASNTGGPGGEGSTLISGYAISNVQFQLDGADPQQLAAVSFTIAPASARTVQVRLGQAGGWYSCTDVASQVSCPTPGQQIENAGEFDVIALS